MTAIIHHLAGRHFRSKYISSSRDDLTELIRWSTAVAGLHTDSLEHTPPHPLSLYLSPYISLRTYYYYICMHILLHIDIHTFTNHLSSLPVLFFHIIIFSMYIIKHYNSEICWRRTSRRRRRESSSRRDRSWRPQLWCQTRTHTHPPLPHTYTYATRAFLIACLGLLLLLQ